MKILHLGCGDDIRPGLDNRDPRINGWRFEDGLPDPDDSVDGITISHAIQNVAREDWPRVFREFHRVLKPQGVLRITDDETEDPTSPRFCKPWVQGGKPVTPTGWISFREIMLETGFKSYRVEPTFSYSHLGDVPGFLIAHREGKPCGSYCCFVEGFKEA